MNLMKYVLIAVAVLIIIAGILFLYERNKTVNIAQLGATTKEVETDLKLSERAKLHTFLQEHAVVGAFYLQQLYDGDDTTDSKAAVENNSAKVIAFFKDDPTFAQSWKHHLDMYDAYTLALKNGDQAAANKAKEDLIMHTAEFGQIVNTIYPTVDATAAANAMKEHGEIVLAIVDAHANDDTSEVAVQSAKASAQATKFAETLVP